MTEPRTESPSTQQNSPGRLSRRRLLGLAGAGAVGLGLGATGTEAAQHAVADEKDAQTVAFHGEHQAGITTSVQSNLHFAAFDVTTTDREALKALLRTWTDAAAHMCAGKEVGDAGALGGPDVAPPQDTGEALGLSAANLTLTIGFGPSLFDDRFGLADRRPAALADLPHFPGDALEPERCGGDLAIQACADDPQVAVHAIRNLTRLAAGTAAIRWAQLGFGKASITSTADETPRNLFGFKDGTANITSDDTEALTSQVWVHDGDGPDWMTGGSYLVARRIRMMIETWDRSPRVEQEQVVGRTKGEGAPLGSAHEHDAIHVAKLPATSHVRLAHPSQHNGARMLRRGYNFVDGSDGLGHLDAGLFFLAYQRDPRTSFVPIQRALAKHDAMSEYLRHTGSGVWAVPPGVRAGDYWGSTLFR